ncbi:hypothetical protein PRIO_5383 [Paenibacillus riograndensis SBR5]|uniref:Uncharacterized protein n=1 Tax=Paenibacillus riograndensis SBR5 TaxID=1073571 RepID=A0A0E4HGZ0_9BACL|nr:hypothetical protein PRIO_5383 [Paenibacillus riograndensis SBR5]
MDDLLPLPPSPGGVRTLQLQQAGFTPVYTCRRVVIISVPDFAFVLNSVSPYNN